MSLNGNAQKCNEPYNLQIIIGALSFNIYLAAVVVVVALDSRKVIMQMVHTSLKYLKSHKKQANNARRINVIIMRNMCCCCSKLIISTLLQLHTTIRVKWLEFLCGLGQRENIELPNRCCC